MKDDRKLTRIIRAMFPLPLSGDEWLLLFEKMDGIKDIDWMGKNQDPEKYHFNMLNTWCEKDIPVKVMEWFSNKYGDDIWQANFVKDKDQTCPFYVLLSSKCLYSYNQKDKESLVYAMERTSNDVISRIIYDDIKENEKLNKEKTFLGYRLSSWNEPLRTLAWFLQKSEGELSAVWIKKNQNIFKNTQYGHNVSTMMGTKSTGLKYYIESGGSVFEPIYRDPYKDNINVDSIPLWLWLAKKNKFNLPLRKTFAYLVNLETEDISKQSEKISPSSMKANDRLSLSYEDIKSVIQNKKEIKDFLLSLRFEKSLASNSWQKSIKDNKKWRKWRNVENANFMHWLAKEDPASFIRSACLIQKNQEMFSYEDCYGNDILPYFVLGLSVGDKGKSGKRRKTLFEKHYPNNKNNLLEHVNTHPEKGLLSQLIELPSGSFFNLDNKLDFMDKSHDVLNAIENIFLDYPDFVWNGLNDIDYSEVITSKKKIDSFSELLNRAFALYHRYDDYDDYSNVNRGRRREKQKLYNQRYDSLNGETKMMLSFFIIVENNDLTMRVKEKLSKDMDEFFQNEEVKKLNLSLECLECICAWRKTRQLGFTSGEYINQVKKIDAFLEREIISKKIEQEMNTKSNDDIDDKIDSENNLYEKPKRKRKM